MAAYRGRKRVQDQGENSQGPPLPQRVIDFVRASIEHIKAGRPKRTEEQVAACLAVCETCPEKVPDQDRCKKCGCYLKLKAQWAGQRCPLKKWPGDS